LAATQDGLPTLDEAVNKRKLSTRETGDFSSESAGLGSNQGLSLDPHDASLPTGENGRRSESCGILRIRARPAEGAAVKGCGKNFDRYFAIEFRVSGPIYLTHATSTNGSKTLVETEASSGSQRERASNDYLTENRRGAGDSACETPFRNLPASRGYF